tara:strand:- start:1139 stop:1465 length:327 start_codon:yes stop_codon:yes gene_type:complete
MSTINNTRNNDNKDNQFSPSNSSTHCERCAPDSEEFSKLLKSLPEELLFGELSTQQQRQFAQSLWEACNYGGRPKPGNFKDMEPKRDYLEWVLRIDHEQQWCNFLKKG